MLRLERRLSGCENLVSLLYADVFWRRPHNPLQREIWQLVKEVRGFEKVVLNYWRKLQRPHPSSLVHWGDGDRGPGEGGWWLEFQPVETLLVYFHIFRLTFPRIVVVASKNIDPDPNNGYSGTLVIAIIVKGPWSPTMNGSSITQFPVTSVRTLQVWKKPGV